jgi:hypothetical protein
VGCIWNSAWLRFVSTVWISCKYITAYPGPWFETCTNTNRTLPRFCRLLPRHDFQLTCPIHVLVQHSQSIVNWVWFSGGWSSDLYHGISIEPVIDCIFFQSLFKNSHNSFRLLQPQLTQDLCCHLALLDHAFRISRLPTPTFVMDWKIPSLSRPFLSYKGSCVFLQRPLHTSRLINSSPPINIFVSPWDPDLSALGFTESQPIFR